MPTISAKAVRDDIQNALDYLVDADLCVAMNAVEVVAKPPLEDGTRIECVRFVSYDRENAFLISADHPNIAQYQEWLRSGAFSTVLFDGSLIQLSYDISEKGEVVGHRLAYMPCPYEVDFDLLKQEPLLDVMELYDGSTNILLRSHLRFDLDLHASAPGHPAAHFTFNSTQCRIACVAPVHVMRFLDFVFRHSYPTEHRLHEPFFAPSAWRHLGDSVLTDRDRLSPHLTWDIRATMSGVGELLGSG